MEGRFAVVSLASRRTQIKEEECHQVVKHPGVSMKLSELRCTASLNDDLWNWS
jgi:hypothetical protein